MSLLPCYHAVSTLFFFEPHYSRVKSLWWVAGVGMVKTLRVAILLVQEYWSGVPLLMEEAGRLQSMGSLSQTRLNDFTFTFHFSLSCIGEGNGNPLQCSCLENPRDRGAWWAAVYGAAQSRTRLKWLSSIRLVQTVVTLSAVQKISIISSLMDRIIKE